MYEVCQSTEPGKMIVLMTFTHRYLALSYAQSAARVMVGKDITVWEVLEDEVGLLVATYRGTPR